MRKPRATFYGGSTDMKKLILLAPLALIAACSQSQPAPEPSATASAAADVPMATDNMPISGTYTATSADVSRTLTQTVNADGTVTTVEGDKTTNGTWTSTGPGNFCITNEGDSEPSCYAESISDSGEWTAVNVKDDKDSWSIKRTG